MNPDEVNALIERASFNADGLLPAIIQEAESRDVLMLGWMNAEAMRRTFTEGYVTFWSRSRQEFWRKGDTSGNHFCVLSAYLDCDTDALLLTIEPVTAACHTGAHSCFEVNPVQIHRGAS